jgi:hypothetical protein
MLIQKSRRQKKEISVSFKSKENDTIFGLASFFIRQEFAKTDGRWLLWDFVREDHFFGKIVRTA